MCEAAPVPVVCWKKLMILTRTCRFVRGKVRGLAGAFESVNDEVVGFDGEMPKIEGDAAEFDAAAGGVLEDGDDLFAHPMLEVRGGGVPRDAADQDQQEKQHAAEESTRFRGLCVLPGCAAVVRPACDTSSPRLLL